MRTMAFYVLTLTVLLLLGLAGRMDVEDAERQRELYCEMATEGYWPVDPKVGCEK